MSTVGQYEEIKEVVHGTGLIGWSIFKTPKGLQYIMPTRYEAHNKVDEVIASSLTKQEAEALIKIINN